MKENKPEPDKPTDPNKPNPQDGLQIGDHDTQGQKEKIEKLEGRVKNSEKLMIFFTGVIAISAVLSVIVVWFQWDVMKGQLKEMQTTTQDYENSFYVQERAFVYFEPLRFGTRIDDRIQKRVWDIDGGIGNSGNTPTLDLSYMVDCSPDVGAIDKFFNDWSDTKSLFLGPKVLIKPMVCTLQTDQITKAFGQNRPIYAFGKAKYQDIIKQKNHTTEFCYEMRVDMFRVDAPNISGQASLCPGRRNHNCADEECEDQKKDPPLPSKTN